MISALESELINRLRVIDERIRSNGILILGIDFDVLTKRVLFIIDLPEHKRNVDNRFGSASILEAVLTGIPGEVLITDEQRKELKFDAGKNPCLEIGLSICHSYVIRDGLYVGEHQFTPATLGQ